MSRASQPRNELSGLSQASHFCISYSSGCWPQDKVMAAAERLLDNAARIRSWVDLSGAAETLLCHMQHGPRILCPVHTVTKRFSRAAALNFM